MKKIIYFDGVKLREVIEGQNEVYSIDFDAEKKVAEIHYEDGTRITIVSSFMTIVESFNIEAGIKLLSALDF